MSTRDLEKTQGCYSFQLIDIHGNFDGLGLGDFEGHTQLRAQGDSYVVTSIMGPQGSGKSTLLNHLYGTNFVSRDRTKVCGKTTNGIWMARSRLEEKMIIILDVEGTDGIERGEDGNFGRQSACFALAVSDIIIFNTEFNAIGRQEGGSIPLLQIMFQVTMEKLFTEDRKKNLMFVIRDKDKDVSDDKIKSKIIENIKQVWASAQVPGSQGSRPLHHFFRVEVVALSHYQHQKASFLEEVDKFRKSSSTDVKGIRAALPASIFSEHLETTWKDVKANRVLDLPSQRELQAEFQCSRILAEVYRSFLADETWGRLDKTTDFESIMEKHLASFDEKTKYYHQEVRRRIRNDLHEKMVQFCQNESRNLKTGRDIFRTYLFAIAAVGGAAAVTGGSLLIAGGITAAAGAEAVGVVAAVSAITAAAGAITTTAGAEAGRIAASARMIPTAITGIGRAIAGAVATAFQYYGGRPPSGAPPPPSDAEPVVQPPSDALAAIAQTVATSLLDYIGRAPSGAPPPPSDAEPAVQRRSKSIVAIARIAATFLQYYIGSAPSGAPPPPSDAEPAMQAPSDAIAGIVPTDFRYHKGNAPSGAPAPPLDAEPAVQAPSDAIAGIAGGAVKTLQGYTGSTNPMQLTAPPPPRSGYQAESSLTRARAQYLSPGSNSNLSEMEGFGSSLRSSSIKLERHDSSSSWAPARLIWFGCSCLILSIIIYIYILWVTSI